MPLNCNWIEIKIIILSIFKKVIKTFGFGKDLKKEEPQRIEFKPLDYDFFKNAKRKINPLLINSGYTKSNKIKPKP